MSQIFIFVVFTAMVAGAQLADIEEMDRALTRMQDARTYDAGVPPVIYILIHANDAPSMQLLMASMKAMLSDRDEDAVFLYHAGLMRARFDRARFPLKESSDESTYETVQSYADMFADAARTFMLRLSPASRANVLKRLERWTPAIPAGYKPGWPYLIVSGEEAARLHVADKKSSLTKLRNEMLAIEKKTPKRR